MYIVIFVTQFVHFGGGVLSEILLMCLILVSSMWAAIHCFTVTDCHKSQPGHISHSMQGSRQKINGILWATSSVQISGS